MFSVEMSQQASERGQLGGEGPSREDAAAEEVEMAKKEEAKQTASAGLNMAIGVELGLGAGALQAYRIKCRQER